MRKAVRSGRIRLMPYVEPELAQRLEKYCAALDATQSAVVAAALRQYMDGTSDATLVLRRLDRLGRSVQRAHRDVELISEAFAVFVRLWFAHTPAIPEDGKRAARTAAEGRYRRFVDHVAEQFSAGCRFLDDLPHEEMADEAELSTVKTNADRPHNPPGT